MYVRKRLQLAIECFGSKFILVTMSNDSEKDYMAQ